MTRLEEEGGLKMDGGCGASEDLVVRVVAVLAWEGRCVCRGCVCGDLGPVGFIRNKRLGRHDWKRYLAALSVSAPRLNSFPNPFRGGDGPVGESIPDGGTETELLLTGKKGEGNSGGVTDENDFVIPPI